MHENLKAIWNQAASSHVQADTSWQTQQNFLNRFAELIVDECAKISNKAEPYKAQDLIKKHFGFHK
jgi:hypothetical protein